MKDETTLPPGWTAEKLEAARVHVVNRMGESNLWVEMNSRVFAALLCEAYADGQASRAGQEQQGQEGESRE